MSLFKKRTNNSLDEFVGGEDRSAAPLEVRGDWAAKLSAITREKPGASDLALPAFSLVRGGDLFEAPQKKREPTPGTLIDTYRARVDLVHNKCAATERDAAMLGVLRVVSGNPAICRRMLLAKPVRVVLVPRGRDFREYGFPPHTNPYAAGIFWNGPHDERALIGLREEEIVRPHLMIHEMAHAVHLMGMTVKEREEIDQMLMPVYRSKRWVEEAVAIYAERAFGAKYSEAELAAPDLYGKTRREWTDRAVFALFMDELLRPKLAR